MRLGFTLPVLAIWAAICLYGYNLAKRKNNRWQITAWLILSVVIGSYILFSLFT